MGESWAPVASCTQTHVTRMHTYNTPVCTHKCTHECVHAHTPGAGEVITVRSLAWHGIQRGNGGSLLGAGADVLSPTAGAGLVGRVQLVELCKSSLMCPRGWWPGLGHTQNWSQGLTVSPAYPPPHAVQGLFLSHHPLPQLSASCM
jgi:hypothetical protein